MVHEKVISDPQIGEVVFRKRIGLKRMTLRVHPVKGVSVSVPYLVSFADALAFFKLKREWVLGAIKRQKQRYKDVPKATDEQIRAMRLQARRELLPRLSELASKYGFIYNKVFIKHNSTNWGSCSTLKNINLNLNLVRLPAVLRDYVMLHELCHLHHHDHGHAFHLLLEHVCTDNLLRACDAGDQTAVSIARAAASSKARFPLDHVCTKAIKQYPLI